MSDLPFEVLDEEGLKDWRSKLPKGYKREYNTGLTSGLQQAPGQGDTAAIEPPKKNATVDPDDPRKVVEAMLQQVTGWALASPENAHLAAQIIRNDNPELSDKTDEELIAVLIQHYEQRVKEVVEQVYRDGRNEWDRGTNLDVQEKGLWLPSPTS